MINRLLSILFLQLIFSVAVAQAGQPKQTKPSREKYKLLIPADVFMVADSQAWIMYPQKIDKKKKNLKWIWYAKTKPGGNPTEAHTVLFEKFLKAGIVIAGVDAGETFGNIYGLTKFTEFYNKMISEYNLSAKPCLLMQSRGSLELLAWAYNNPDKIKCAAAIYPVMDVTKYPGVNAASRMFQMPAKKFKQNLTLYNPIDNLEVYVKSKVPFFLIHGNNDTKAPLEQHSKAFYDRYKKLGGKIELVEVEGHGHYLWPGYFENPNLADFFIKNCH